MFRSILLLLFVYAVSTTVQAQRDKSYLYRFEDKHGLYGYTNAKRDTIVPAQFEWATKFDDAGRALVKIRGKCGMLNLEGKYLIPVEYDNVSMPSEGICCLTLNGLTGYWNLETGKIISPIQWEKASIFIDGFGRVTRNGLLGIVNREGTLVCKPEFEDMEDRITEGFVKVRKDHKYGFLDATTWKLVVPTQWTYAKNFSEGFSLVITGDGNYGFIDKTGKLAIALAPGEIPMDFQEGYAGVVKDKKGGFINTKGKVVIPFVWDDATKFRLGYAAVKRNGKWGFIDKTGKVIIDTIYDEVTMWTQQQADGKRNNTWEKIYFPGAVSVVPPVAGP